MNVGWPEGIWLGLIASHLLLVATLHGRPRDDRWNFHGALYGNAVTFALLYWGGFFA